MSIKRITNWQFHILQDIMRLAIVNNHICNCAKQHFTVSQILDVKSCVSAFIRLQNRLRANTFNPALNVSQRSGKSFIALDHNSVYHVNMVCSGTILNTRYHTINAIKWGK